MSTNLNTQLIEATKAGDDPLARHLIYLGADIHTADLEENIAHDAPLIWALRNNNLNLVSTFLQFGANPSSILNNALRYACKDGDLKAVVSLIASGAEATQDILEEIKTYNHTHILEWLTQYYAKSQARNASK